MTDEDDDEDEEALKRSLFSGELGEETTTLGETCEVFCRFFLELKSVTD